MQVWSALRREWDRESESHPVRLMLLIWVPVLMIIDAGLIYLAVTGGPLT